MEASIHIEPLRIGDARTVMAMFERLSERSRRARFNGPKPRLTFDELRQLTSVDRTRYVLVVYIDSDPDPVAIGRFVRDGRSAAIAFAVADEYQRRGIGTVVAGKLIADASAAGITEIVALVSSSNRAVALLRGVLTAIEICIDGVDFAIRARVAQPTDPDQRLRLSYANLIASARSTLALCESRNRQTTVRWGRHVTCTAMVPSGWPALSPPPV
jgi:ribosomal protein S18 acetylase RimI-like enzyme